jgi:hypothetical protein
MDESVYRPLPHCQEVDEKNGHDQSRDPEPKSIQAHGHEKGGVFDYGMVNANGSM